MVKEFTEKDISKLKLEDILSFAAKSEIEAQHLYEKISKINRDASLETLVDRLIDEEKSHERKIRSMFNDFFPEKEIGEFDVDKDDFSDITEIKDEDNGVKALLEIAIEKEKRASEFYRTLSEEVDDKDAVSNLLSYLAYMENEHHSLLQKELSGRK
ncbi:MAG: ferritin family protein [Candidatus Thermoplasmatota archaeon]|nr:ferritin family protein [Candidatus Thermoplasmatota archaeon]